MNSGAVEKVRIDAYVDKKLQKPNTSGKLQTFYLPVNPENYSKNLKIESDQSSALGDQGTDSRFTRTPPEELKLEFIFDGTGTIENYKYTDSNKRSVKDQLDLFLKTVYYMKSETHRPNFLIVFWGTYLNFSCVLSNLDINYQLFSPDGDPLRIKLSATFLGHHSPDERTALMRRSSPDLTHLRETKAGDRLDLMTHDIYNDTKYLLQVARKNGLTSFRQLDSGMKLHFPPIDKTGS